MLFYFQVQPAKLKELYSLHSMSLAEYQETLAMFEVKNLKTEACIVKTALRPYRARTGFFPCEVFRTGKNLFSFTGISLWEKLPQETLFSLQGMGFQCSILVKFIETWGALVWLPFDYNLRLVYFTPHFSVWFIIKRS